MLKRRRIRKGIKILRKRLDRKKRPFSEDETEIPYACPQEKGK